MDIFTVMMKFVHSFFLPQPSSSMIKYIHLQTSTKSKRIAVPLDVILLVAEKGFDEFIHPLLNEWTFVDTSSTVDDFCFRQNITSAYQERLLSLLIYELCPNYVNILNLGCLFMFVHHSTIRQVKAIGFMSPNNPSELDPWYEPFESLSESLSDFTDDD